MITTPSVLQEEAKALSRETGCFRSHPLRVELGCHAGLSIGSFQPTTLVTGQAAFQGKALEGEHLRAVWQSRCAGDRMARERWRTVASDLPPRMHFTDVVLAAFFLPSQLFPKEVACSQAAPEGLYSDLPRAMGQWPSQRPLLHPHSQNPRTAGLGIWTLEAESRGALVFTTWTATQETDA